MKLENGEIHQSIYGHTCPTFVWLRSHAMMIPWSFINVATWQVFPPGAEHMSNMASPGIGESAWPTRMEGRFWGKKISGLIPNKGGASPHSLSVTWIALPRRSPNIWAKANTRPIVNYAFIIILYFFFLYLSSFLFIFYLIVFIYLSIFIFLVTVEVTLTSFLQTRRIPLAIYNFDSYSQLFAPLKTLLETSTRTRTYKKFDFFFFGRDRCLCQNFCFMI